MPQPEVADPDPKERPDSFDKIREWATARADDWCLSDGIDRLAFDDLAPARPLRVEIFNLLFSIALQRVGLVSDLDRGGATSWLKQRGMDRAVRSWLLRTQVSRRGSIPGSARVVVVSEMATPSALLASAAVLQVLPRGSAMAYAADPRASSFWRGRGVPTAPLLIPLRKQRAVLQDAKDGFEQIWRRIESDPPRLVLGDVDISESALPAIKQFLHRSVPWLHVERHAIARALETHPPEVVLLASDQHRIGSLTVTEAQRRSIPTAVLQHGLPQHAVGYLPVAADRVLTWSERSTAWFVDRGTEPRRLTVVGNPVWDAFAESTKRTGDPAADPGPILLALTPSTWEINASIVGVALDALDLMTTTRLVVKLHPGDGHWAYVRKQIEKHQNAERVQVAHREPLAPLLTAASATWLHRSSVALESLAAQVPVVVIAAAAPSTANAELHDLRLPVASTADELASLSLDLLRPEARAAYFTSRPIAAHVGPADGQSARRVIDALDGLVALGHPSRAS